MRRVCWLLLAMAIADWSASGRLVAVELPIPEPHGVDVRDADTPDPIFADGSPGQYRLIGTKWPQPGGRGTTVTLTYSFQNMFDGGIKMPNGQSLPASIIRSSIEEALGLWAAVAPLNFIEVPDDGLGYGLSTHYGQLRFRHIYMNGQDPAIGDPIAKAQAYYPSGDPYPGDVEFDEGDRWQEAGTLHLPDILGAATHEIGHTLGLDHSTGIIPGQYYSYQRYESGVLVDHLEPKGNANMFWIFTRTSGLGTGQLYPDDIAGIQAIYGAGSGRLTSLVNPEPGTLTLLLLAMGGWLLRRPVR